MTSKATVEEFLAQRTLAVVGVSRGGKKFGNVVHGELKDKGYQVFPVNPNASTIDGERCYPSLGALPEAVGGVVIVVPPSVTDKVVREAAQAGIRRVWMQQGSESHAAIRFCEERGISAIHGECILMHAGPSAIHHRLHRWVWGLMGRLPQ